MCTAVIAFTSREMRATYFLRAAGNTSWKLISPPDRHFAPSRAQFFIFTPFQNIPFRVASGAADVERCGVKCCGGGDSREIYAAPGTEMALDEAAAAALCIRADAADRGENRGTRSSPQVLESVSPCWGSVSSD